MPTRPNHLAGDHATDATDATDPPDLAASYNLGGPDAHLFTIDPATGNIDPQDWFQPSIDDAWDQDEDFTYDLTRTATFADGRSPVTETLHLDTLAEGVLSAPILAPVAPGDAAAPQTEGTALMAMLSLPEDTPSELAMMDDLDDEPAMDDVV